MSLPDQRVVVYEGRAGWGWRIVENGRTVQASIGWHVSEVSARIVAEHNARKRAAPDETGLRTDGPSGRDAESVREEET